MARRPSTRHSKLLAARDFRPSRGCVLLLRCHSQQPAPLAGREARPSHHEAGGAAIGRRAAAAHY